MKDGISVKDILEHSYELYPDKEYWFNSKQNITYKQLYQESRLLATSLNHLGINKGDKVLVCLPNWHEFVAVFFGLAHLGAVMIPCNPCYKREDVLPILENGDIKAAFLAEENHIMEVLRSNGIDILVTVRYQEEASLSYEDLLSIGKTVKDIPSTTIDPENDVMAILYSSGTTGRPKGVMLTHQNLLYAANIAKNQLNCTKEDTIFVPVPVFHVFGLVPGILLTILTGARLVFMEKYKAVKALQLIDQGKVTIHLGVPTMYILELNKMEETHCDISSLRTGIIAGSPCPSNVVKDIRNKMGCNIKISYGMTETASAVTFTSFDDDEIICSNTVGRAVPGTEIKVVDEHRQELPYGEIGELACRGLGRMKGYYNMPEKTNEVIDQDGWYYTGDLAILDEKGYCSIVGRKKDMITRGGYKIYPREIEEILYKHPSILDVAIVGLPNPVLGETSCAFIKLKRDCKETEESIKYYLKHCLVKYKVPDQVLFLDNFPMNHNGKVMKNILKEMATNQHNVYRKQLI